MGKRRAKFMHHLAKRRRERGPSSDHYVIVTGVQPAGSGGGRNAHHLAQASAHPVAFHRIADLARYGKADTRHSGFGASPRLQHESAPRGAQTLRSGTKIIPAFQPLNDDGTGVLITH